MRTRLGLAVLLCCAAAAAQRPAPELRARVGAAWFLDEDLPAHLATGFSFRAYLTERLSIEPEFLHTRHSNSSSEKAYLVLPNVAYDFAEPGARVAPYAIGGLGLFRSRTSFPGGGFTQNDLTFLGGAGARFFLKPRLTLFPELRIGIEPNLYLVLTVGVGFVLGSRGAN